MNVPEDYPGGILLMNLRDSANKQEYGSDSEPVSPTSTCSHFTHLPASLASSMCGREIEEDMARLDTCRSAINCDECIDDTPHSITEAISTASSPQYQPSCPSTLREEYQCSSSSPHSHAGVEEEIHVPLSPYHEDEAQSSTSPSYNKDDLSSLSPSHFHASSPYVHREDEVAVSDTAPQDSDAEAQPQNRTTHYEHTQRPVTASSACSSTSEMTSDSHQQQFVQGQDRPVTSTTCSDCELSSQPSPNRTSSPLGASNTNRHSTSPVNLNSAQQERPTTGSSTSSSSINEPSPQHAKSPYTALSPVHLTPAVELPSPSVLPHITQTEEMPSTTPQLAHAEQHAHPQEEEDNDEVPILLAPPDFKTIHKKIDSLGIAFTAKFHKDIPLPPQPPPVLAETEENLEFLETERRVRTKLMWKWEEILGNLMCKQNPSWGKMWRSAQHETEMEEAGCRTKITVEECIIWARLLSSYKMETAVVTAGVDVEPELHNLRLKIAAQAEAGEESQRANLESVERGARRDLKQECKKEYDALCKRERLLNVLKAIGYLWNLIGIQRWVRKQFTPAEKKRRRLKVLMEKRKTVSEIIQKRAPYEQELMEEADIHSLTFDLHCRARTVQRAYRRSVRQHKRKLQASIKLQSVARGFICRRRMPKLYELLDEQNVIFQTQSLERKWVVKEEVQDRKELSAWLGGLHRLKAHKQAWAATLEIRKVNKAATDIQRVWRGLRGRLCVDIVRHDMHNCKATLIQKVYRGWAVRCGMDNRRESAENEKRRKLEAYWRSQSHKEQDSAALLIQRNVRGFLSRRVTGKLKGTLPEMEETVERKDIIDEETHEREEFLSWHSLVLGRHGVKPVTHTTPRTRARNNARKQQRHINAEHQFDLSDQLWALQLNESAGRAKIVRNEVYGWSAVTDEFSIDFISSHQREKERCYNLTIQNRAATKIQALFRGYYTRTYIIKSRPADLIEEQHVLADSEFVARKELERRMRSTLDSVLRLYSSVHGHGAGALHSALLTGHGLLKQQQSNKTILNAQLRLSRFENGEAVNQEEEEDDEEEYQQSADTITPPVDVLADSISTQSSESLAAKHLAFVHNLTLSLSTDSKVVAAPIPTSTKPFTAVQGKLKAGKAFGTDGDADYMQALLFSKRVGKHLPSLDCMQSGKQPVSTPTPKPQKPKRTLPRMVPAAALPPV